MNSIIDYISWRGDIIFKSSPFNDIDALILCQISYLNFDGLLDDNDFKNSISLFGLAEKFKASPDFESRCDTGLLINHLTVKLFLEAAESERFRDIKVTGYTSVIDLEHEEQFSAVTFKISPRTNFIAFRGTDDNIVGWKEDFNLAIMDEVPAQTDAVKYLKKAASKLHGELLVGGHSKGGNLAVYAAAKASTAIKNRIKNIYNMDGPGFSEEKINSKEFQEIIPKILSYYPHFSIVGMIFSHAGAYTVVESDESGLMQHDPFSWHISGKNFVVLDGFDKASDFFHDTFNVWIREMEPEQREFFIETMFNVIQATDARTNSEIEKNLLGNSVKIISALIKLKPEERNVLEKAIKLLFSIAHKKIPPFASLLKIKGSGQK